MAYRSVRSYARMLSAALHGLEKEKDISSVLSAFARFLFRERALSRFDEIVDRFREEEGKASMQRKGVLFVRDAVAAGEVQKSIEKATGMKLKVSVVEDKEIIGGGKFVAEDVVYDATINTQIARAHRTLLET